MASLLLDLDAVVPLSDFDVPVDLPDFAVDAVGGCRESVGVYNY